MREDNLDVDRVCVCVLSTLYCVTPSWSLSLLRSERDASIALALLISKAFITQIRILDNCYQARNSPFGQHSQSNYPSRSPLLYCSVTSRRRGRGRRTQSCSKVVSNFFLKLSLVFSKLCQLSIKIPSLILLGDQKKERQGKKDSKLSQSCLKVVSKLFKSCL